LCFNKTKFAAVGSDFLQMTDLKFCPRLQFDHLRQKPRIVIFTIFIIGFKFAFSFARLCRWSEVCFFKQGSVWVGVLTFLTLQERFD